MVRCVRNIRVLILTTSYRMTSLAVPPIRLLQNSSEIKAIIEQMRQAYLLDSPPSYSWERRAGNRLEITVPVVITPLDENFTAGTYYYGGVTHDISESGIGLTTTNPEATRYIMLTLQPINIRPFSLVAVMRHCTDFGWHFRLGCEFLTEPANEVAGPTPHMRTDK